MMKGNLLLGMAGCVVISSCAKLIKAYGEYKYNRGQMDGMDFSMNIIDSQHKTIKDLLEKLKKQEEGSR